MYVQFYKQYCLNYKFTRQIVFYEIDIDLNPLRSQEGGISGGQCYLRLGEEERLLERVSSRSNRWWLELRNSSSSRSPTLQNATNIWIIYMILSSCPNIALMP